MLPERFAEQRHHPQTAIQTLCLLSLVFGGLLWPIAWVWAFTKPVIYKGAYGTDKREEWHEEMGEKARAGALLGDELEHLRAELDAMAARGALPAKLRQLRADLDALKPAAEAPAGARRRVMEVILLGIMRFRLADLHQVQVAPWNIYSQVTVSSSRSSRSPR